MPERITYHWWRSCHTKRGKYKGFLVLHQLARQFFHRPINIGGASLLLRHLDVISHTTSILDDKPSPWAKWLDPPSHPAEDWIHSPESVRYKSTEPSHQGVDFRASIFRALSLHVGVHLEIVRREVGEAGLVRRGCVLAVEVGFLPVLDMTRQDGFRKERTLTAL